MGCTSSSTTADWQVTLKKPKKGVLPCVVQLDYMPGMGRADPLRQMFEYHGQPYVKIDIKPEAWNERKSCGEGGEFDGGGLPQVQFRALDGTIHRLSQFGAILRFFGIKYGYYDTGNWKASAFIDPVVDTFSDLIYALAQYAMASDEQKPYKMEDYLVLAKNIHSLIEANLM